MRGVLSVRACYVGDKPEELYAEARQELRQLGYESTLEYVADAAGTVMRETGLLPHINAGVMGLAEVTTLLWSYSTLTVTLGAEHTCVRPAHNAAPACCPCVLCLASYGGALRR